MKNQFDMMNIMNLSDPIHHVELEADAESLHSTGPFDRRATKLKSIAWPALLVLVPMTAIVGTLAGLILKNQVRAAQSSTLSQQPSFQYDRSYVLVNYSATRLTFLASWLSTLAPVLSASIMGLWCCCAARALQEASRSGSVSQLPTASGIDREVAILRASFLSLWRYYIDLLKIFWQRLCRQSTSSESPGAMHASANVLSLCGLIVLTTFTSEAYLDSFTQTVQVDVATTSEVTTSAFGRGLSTLCLGFDREQNVGFPCSYIVEPILSASQATEEDEDANEVFYLQHNMSRTSSIQIIQDMAVLLPQTLTLPGNVDFEATTIGVSTNCRPITSACDLRVAKDDPYHTEFNCSENFWGVLGKAPNITELTLTYTKATDPDLPGMNFKPSPSLQYGFYANDGLSKIYTTAKYNPQTGDLDSKATMLPDSKLINPTYMGVAGRIGISSESVGSNLSNDGEFFQSITGEYADFILSCHYTTYNVKYTWLNGTIADLSSSATTNGSVSEIYHGCQVTWEAPSDTSFLLQDDLLMAAVQNTTTDMAREWANLHSVRVLSTIGAFTTPRNNFQEQVRTPLLVAQIPLVALATLVAGSLSYVVLAIVLVVVVLHIVRTNPSVLCSAQWLSQSGLAASAFRANDGDVKNDDVFSAVLTAEKHSTHSQIRVGVSSKGFLVMPFLANG